MYLMTPPIYILILPNGTDGWHPRLTLCNVPSKRRKALKMWFLIRASGYTSFRKQLGDAQRTENRFDAVQTGCMFILLSMYVSVDRYIRQNIQDIIEISNNVEYPKIFLTATFNPHWPEIKNA